MLSDPPPFAGPQCPRCGEIGVHGDVDACLLSLRAAIHDLRAQLPALVTTSLPHERVHEQIRHYRGISA